MQRSFPVSYRGELIGNLIPDLIVDNAVIVDPKVVACFHRDTYCPNDWVSEHHRLGFGYSLSISKMRGWNGNACCVRKSAEENPSLIYMPSFSYPCYPCNPWLMP